MNVLPCMILLQFMTTLAFGQLAHPSRPPNPHKQPDAMVRGLYHEVVARHPVGIPRDADMKIFAPYLSKALLHRIDLAIACSADEARQHQDAHLKPEIAWLEAGLFSGDDEQASPTTFHIERTQEENDGSFHVFVRLTWGAPSKLWIWRVVAIVIRENDRFVVDDVIYLKDENRDADSQLSAYLASGCDGSRWVGRGKSPGFKVDGHPNRSGVKWKKAVEPDCGIQANDAIRYALTSEHYLALKVRGKILTCVKPSPDLQKESTPKGPA